MDNDVLIYLDVEELQTRAEVNLGRRLTEKELDYVVYHVKKLWEKNFEPDIDYLIIEAPEKTQ